jgi:hypothetical protein
MMTAKTNRSKVELIRSFPLQLRGEADAVLSVVSEDPLSGNWQFFDVRFGEEVLSIPYRIYFDPSSLQTVRLTSLQSELLDCLFTRHHDGLVRQKHLERIIRSRNRWVPCFIVPLVGEYVVEILRVIEASLPQLDTSAFADFARANPDFLALTAKRVTSYWDCYYRSVPKEKYPGFLIMDFLKFITNTRGQ